MSRIIVFGGIILSIFLSCSENAKHDEPISWKISNPIFSPGLPNSPDEISVKDPSIVFFEGNWHLFYTARDSNEYTTRYVSAPSLEELNTAKRFDLQQIRGNSRYGCAPQIFYFEPQKLWYLIFQNKNSNYQPAFSTNPDITNPNGWTEASDLIAKDSEDKWIDFWVIADQDKAYLFYTESHSDIKLRSTSLENFPNGWQEAQTVFDSVHEAVHVYKDIAQDEYHLIYELNLEGKRQFGLAKADKLVGPWQKIADNYATGSQLNFPSNQSKWTDMVSHGEAIRSGFDQNMEYNSAKAKWLIQGTLNEEITKDYPIIPWQLGIIELNMKP